MRCIDLRWSQATRPWKPQVNKKLHVSHLRNNITVQTPVLNKDYTLFWIKKARVSFFHFITTALDLTLIQMDLNSLKNRYFFLGLSDNKQFVFFCGIYLWLQACPSVFSLKKWVSVSLVIEIFINAQNWQYWNCCQLCIPIYLPFLYLHYIILVNVKLDVSGFKKEDYLWKLVDFFGLVYVKWHQLKQSNIDIHVLWKVCENLWC